MTFPHQYSAEGAVLTTISHCEFRSSVPLGLPLWASLSAFYRFVIHTPKRTNQRLSSQRTKPIVLRGFWCECKSQSRDERQHGQAIATWQTSRNCSRLHSQNDKTYSDSLIHRPRISEPCCADLRVTPRTSGLADSRELVGRVRAVGKCGNPVTV